MKTKLPPKPIHWTKKRSSIKIISAGYKVGNRARITIGKKTISGRWGGRGLNVVCLSARTHKVILNKSYDTHGSSSNSNRCRNDLKRLGLGTIVIVAVKDEA